MDPFRCERCVCVCGVFRVDVRRRGALLLARAGGPPLRTFSSMPPTQPYRVTHMPQWYQSTMNRTVLNCAGEGREQAALH